MNNNIEKGKKRLAESTLLICGIVRDCEFNLKKNISTIENIRLHAKESHVVIFENDSIDNTKKVLHEWSISFPNVHIMTDSYNKQTIPRKNEIKSKVNPYFSEYRIRRMCFFRNKYLEYIERNNLTADYIIIVDLDVARIYTNGIFDSFSYDIDWDAIGSNCFSRLPYGIKRYYDTYALIKIGQEDIPQTYWGIKWECFRWRYFTKKKNLMPVFCAFGGLAIYKFNKIKDLRHYFVPNNDIVVESRADHFSLCKQINERGGRIYINKKMKIKYQRFTLDFVLNKLFNR